MMWVGEMRVTMNESIVAMAMGVLRGCRHFFAAVIVLVVLIVHMLVLVLQRFMCVLMAMPLRKVEPNAKSHEAAAD